MKKSQNYFFAALLIIFCFLVLDARLNEKMLSIKGIRIQSQSEKNKMHQANKTESRSAAHIDTSSSSTNQSAEKNSLAAFKQQLKAESNLIGQTTEHIEETEKRLQQMADNLDAYQLNYLKSVVMDLNQAGDERALAIELLSRNTSNTAAQILKEFALSNDRGLRGVAKDQEIVFKAQAIEGIAAQPEKSLALQYLSEISRKTDSAFLNDRALRAQAVIKDNVQSLEKQDQKALEKLVK